MNAFGQTPCSPPDRGRSSTPDDAAPALPWELLQMVIGECRDARSTLAVLARTAKGLSRTAMGVLYEDVELETWEDIEWFFFRRAASKETSEASRAIDLAKIRSVILKIPTNLTSIYPGVVCPFSLISSFPGPPRVLGVHTLHISYSGDDPIQPKLSHLLSLFDPLHFVFHKTSVRSPHPGCMFLDGRTLRTWTRLRSLDMSHALFASDYSVKLLLDRTGRTADDPLRIALDFAPRPRISAGTFNEDEERAEAESVYANLLGLRGETDRVECTIKLGKDKMKRMLGWIEEWNAPLSIPGVSSGLDVSGVRWVSVEAGDL